MTRQRIEICSIWPLALAMIFVTTVLLLHATEIALKALPFGASRNISSYMAYMCAAVIARINLSKTPRTLRYGKHEKIIFPYAYDENRLVRFADGEFERLYPEAAAYLNEFRDELGKRQSNNGAKWYEYGRSQALNDLNNTKLLLSTVVTNDVDVCELEQECIPYAGMYIIEKEDNTEYTLAYAMKILRSDEFKEYVFNVGIPINGKSVRITSKDVENYMFTMLERESK